MDKQLNANPTPKALFREVKGAVDAHHTLIETESFKRACDSAMLEYQRKQAVNQGLDMNERPQYSQVIAMANAYKMQGALEFLAELRNLAEAPKELLPPGKARMLDHPN